MENVSLIVKPRRAGISGDLAPPARARNHGCEYLERAEAWLGHLLSISLSLSLSLQDCCHSTETTQAFADEHSSSASTHHFSPPVPPRRQKVSSHFREAELI